MTPTQIRTLLRAADHEVHCCRPQTHDRLMVLGYVRPTVSRRMVLGDYITEAGWAWVAGYRAGLRDAA